MELLQFVFSSFWIFIGTLILLSTFLKGTAEVLQSLAAIIQAFRESGESEDEEEPYTEASYEVVEE